VRLFTRTARGAQLMIDDHAFLPHARELLRVAERADASVRPGRRALRVDVVNRRAQLAGYRIWMPGLAARGEVAAYYGELTTTFGLNVDMLGPVFGNEALLDEIAIGADRAGGDAAAVFAQPGEPLRAARGSVEFAPPAHRDEFIGTVEAVAPSWRRARLRCGPCGARTAALMRRRSTRSLRACCAAGTLCMPWSALSSAAQERK
jgi:hypothetical protein